MSDLLKYPLQDNYSTNLSRTLTNSASDLTIYVNTVPSFSFPSGVTTFAVINAGKSNMEIVEIESFNTSLKTLTVKSGGRAKSQYNGHVATAQTHPSGSSLIISDNFAFWSAIAEAIASKVDDDADTTITANTTWSTTSKSGARLNNLTTAQRTAITPANGDLVFDTDLAALYYGSGSVWYPIGSSSPSPNGSATVAGLWEGATVAEQISQSATGGTGAGLVLQPKYLVKTSSGAGDEGKIVTLNSSGKFPSGFIPSNTLASYISDVTATATEINQVTDGVSDNVTAANLNTLTAETNFLAELGDYLLLDPLGSDVLLPSGSAATVTFQFRVPVGKTISSVSIIYNTSYAASGNVAYTTGMGYGTLNGTYTSSSGGTVNTFTPVTTTGTPKIEEKTITATIGAAFTTPTAGQFVRIGFSRDGAHASDTYTQWLEVHKLKVNFA